MNRPTLRRGAPRSRGATLLPFVVVLALVGAVLGPGCGSGTTPAAGANAQPRTLTVFAAASLTDAFTQLGDLYSAGHPGVDVVCNFAGSSDLVAQLQQGAPADVLATADTGNMDKVTALTGPAQAFAGNKLIIAVEAGNPKHLTGLADLAGGDVKVVLAAPEVPAGKYALEALAKAGVTVKPASLEVSVKGVVTKVSLGEADAGIVYVTDVTAAKGAIEGVPIPDDQNVLATYPIATLDEAASPRDARAFVNLVLAAEGQRVLAGQGFLPAP